MSINGLDFSEKWKWNSETQVKIESIDYQRSIHSEWIANLFLLDEEYER